MRRRSVSRVTGRTQTQTQGVSTPHPGVALTKRTENSKCRQTYGEKESLRVAGRGVKCLRLLKMLNVTQQVYS